MSVSDPRDLVRRFSNSLYRPVPQCRGHSWIGDERLAIGALPVLGDLAQAKREGVTHVINCRHDLQTIVSQDLWAEREMFGAENVDHASMWDNGRPKAPEVFARAARFGAEALEDPDARLLVHCQQGRRRSAMVAYAVLRLRGRSPEEAARVILTHRPVARIVPAYRASVEAWLASGAPAPPLR